MDASIRLSKTQYSPHKYFAIASHPLNDTLLAVKSKTLNLLFSSKCSVIMYIASQVKLCFYREIFSNPLLEWNIFPKWIAVSYPIEW